VEDHLHYYCLLLQSFIDIGTRYNIKNTKSMWWFAGKFSVEPQIKMQYYIIYIFKIYYLLEPASLNLRGPLYNHEKLADLETRSAVIFRANYQTRPLAWRSFILLEPNYVWRDSVWQSSFSSICYCLHLWFP